MLSQIIEANPKLQPHDQAHSKYYFNSTTKKIQVQEEEWKISNSHIYWKLVIFLNIQKKQRGRLPAYLSCGTKRILHKYCYPMATPLYEVQNLVYVFLPQFPIPEETY